MNQILSQDEVDALLKGLDKGEIDTEQEIPEEESDYPKHDWTSQGKKQKASMPLLNVVHSRFAERLRHSLSNSLRKLVDIDMSGLELIKVEEFQRTLPIPTSLHLFKMEPLKGMGMLVIETRLVFSLIEAYLGGTGTGSAKIEGREFTPIENRIIKKVVDIALEDLQTAWSEIYPLKLNFVKSETNPLGITIAPPADYLLTIKAEVELKKPAGYFTLCIPYSSLQPIKDRLAGQYMKDEEETDKNWVALLKERISESAVEISVELGRAQLAVRDFLNMKEGDILVLEKEVKSSLIAKVEGIPKFLCVPGKHGNRAVFKIEELIGS